MSTTTSAARPEATRAPVAPRGVAAPPAPDEDRRWHQVDVRIRQMGARPDGLIEVLHTIQALFGYLDDDALAYVSEALGVPPSQVMGVATFYSFFMLKPQGEHTCVVCTGTACYMGGARGVLDRIRQLCGVATGQTTADNKLSVLGARCLGACSVAPVVVLDGQVHGKVTGEAIETLLAHL